MDEDFSRGLDILEGHLLGFFASLAPAWEASYVYEESGQLTNVQAWHQRAFVLGAGAELLKAYCCLVQAQLKRKENGNRKSYFMDEIGKARTVLAGFIEGVRQDEKDNGRSGKIVRDDFVDLMVPPRFLREGVNAQRYAGQFLRQLSQITAG